MTELQRNICLTVLIYLVQVAKSNKPPMMRDFPLNLALSVLLTLAAEAYLVDGQL